MTRTGQRSRGSVLLRRLIAGFIIAPPFVLGAYAGGGWVLLGVTIPTILALREFYALSRRPGRRLMEPLGFLLAFGILLANGGRELLLGTATENGLAATAAPSGFPGAGFLEALLTPDRFAYFARFSVAAAVIVPLIALLFEKSDTRGRLTGWALTLAGTLYVAWLISHFQTMRLLGGDTHAGRGWIFYTFAATWSFDTGAYLVGSRLGRTPFMSHISPKKTWEGTIGGFVFCLIATVIAGVSLPAGTPVLVDPFGWSPLPIALWQAPLLALGMSAAASFGDLAESMIKREAGAKDAGELIPGHGGMLDRLDSLLFTVVLAYYYAVWFGGLG
ncbi:MAG TPA: phosphatidate cytidylyltransferase [Chloroflexota bacterium]|nr:phosphatidate cytidylyltransferase [Chloroflexota bacterium]